MLLLAALCTYSSTFLCTGYKMRVYYTQRMDLWFEKYRPHTIDEIIISEAKRNALRKWFQEFQEGQTSQCAILFTGPPGLGKTSLAHAILREFGYRPKEFNASDIRSKSLIHENLDGLINVTDVKSVTSVGAQPVGIIMDEVDGMFKGDRGGVEELLSFISIPSKRRRKANNNTNRKIPVICICNIGSIKKDTIKQLQKECFELSFNLPSSQDMMKVLDRVATAESLEIEEEARDAIVEYAQGDYRRLVSILEFLAIVYGRRVTMDNVRKTYNILCRKERDLYITDSIQKLINEKLTGTVIHNIYDGDKSKTPMVVHQNYLRAITAQKSTTPYKLHAAIRCIDNLVTSDIIEKAMYNNQSWYLQPIQGYTSAQIPNYYISLYPKASVVTASWASVLSINSQSQNLKKNIYEVLYGTEQTHSYSIQDIQHLIEVIFHYMVRGDTATAVRLLQGYGLCQSSEFDEKPDKKALSVIDKIAKYIKISPMYGIWAEFRDANKNNRELDGRIKEYVRKYHVGITEKKGVLARYSAVTKVVKAVTAKPKIKPKAKPTEEEAETPDVARAPTVSKPAPKTVIAIARPKTKEEQVALAGKRQTIVVKKKTAATSSQAIVTSSS